MLRINKLYKVNSAIIKLSVKLRKTLMHMIVFTHLNIKELSAYGQIAYIKYLSLRQIERVLQRFQTTVILVDYALNSPERAKPNTYLNARSRNLSVYS